MDRLHLQRNLRTFVFLSVVLLAIALPVGVFWINQTGLPDSWRTTIQSRLDEAGIYVEIGSLSYSPLRGLVAGDVSIYNEQERIRVVSRVERMILGFDKTKLARGKVELTKIRLLNARVMLPVDPDAENSEILEVRDLNGILLINPGRRFEIQTMTGWVAGIEVDLHARIIAAAPSPAAPGKTPGSNRRREAVSYILKELQKWNFEEASPPRLSLWVEGDFNKPTTIESRAVLEVAQIEKNGATLQDVSCEIEVKHSVITLDRFVARDGMGQIAGRGDYELFEKAGRFETTSTIDLFLILDSWFGIGRPNQVLVGGKRKVDAQGTFRTTGSGSLEMETLGRFELGSVLLKGVLFEKVASRFAWKGGSLYLRDLHLSREDGMATGKLMVEWPHVRLALDSNLPAAVYEPIFEGKPLQKVIRDFSAREGSQCIIKLEGGFDATDRYSWAYSGSATLREMDFRGVPLTHVSCDLTLNHDELDFSNGVIGFDYWKYPMRVAHNGPKSAEAKIGRVHYISKDKLVEFEDVSGEFWPAPLIRLFASGIADRIEKYRFHTPPVLKGAGVVDVTPQKRTNLNVRFRSTGGVTTELLGKDVVLMKPKGQVHVSGDGVTVSELTGLVFDGGVQVEVRSSAGARLEVETSWTRLDLSKIAGVYDFSVKSGGALTGRIDIGFTAGEIKTVEGNGLIAIEDTELFSVPMFGPLSTVVSGVLNDKRVGYERASDAFCTFAIRKGVVETRDFNTRTRSLNFAGDGRVDLAEQTMDMTMRMNARGLLGLLTIPLRPLAGMFQFRGTGPIRKPKWENVMFTAPPPEQAAMLEKNPPKAQVVEP